jgi:transcriptional regulator with GAF, ATPase, and Fis domain
MISHTREMTRLGSRHRLSWSLKLNFEEIVGESRALKHVLTQVNTVAPLDATVLILGKL